MDLKENRQCKSRDGFCFHHPWFCCLLPPLWISCLRWHAYVLGFFWSVLHESTIYLEDKVCIHFCYSLCTQFLPPFYFSTGHSYLTPKKHGCSLEGTIQGNARSGGASLGMGTGLLTQQGLHPPHHNRMKQDSNLVAVRKKTATITSGWWVV